MDELYENNLLFYQQSDGSFSYCVEHSISPMTGMEPVLRDSLSKEENIVRLMQYSDVKISHINAINMFEKQPRQKITLGDYECEIFPQKKHYHFPHSILKNITLEQILHEKWDLDVFVYMENDWSIVFNHTLIQAKPVFKLLNYLTKANRYIYSMNEYMVYLSKTAIPSAYLSSQSEEAISKRLKYCQYKMNVISDKIVKHVESFSSLNDFYTYNFSGRRTELIDKYSQQYQKAKLYRSLVKQPEKQPEKQLLSSHKTKV